MDNSKKNTILFLILLVLLLADSTYIYFVYVKYIDLNSLPISKWLYIFFFFDVIMDAVLVVNLWLKTMSHTKIGKVATGCCISLPVIWLILGIFHFIPETSICNDECDLIKHATIICFTHMIKYFAITIFLVSKNSNELEDNRDIGNNDVEYINVDVNNGYHEMTNINYTEDTNDDNSKIDIYQQHDIVV